jgi:hypothetical protein
VPARQTGDLLGRVRQDDDVSIAAVLAKESPKIAATTTIVVLVAAVAVVGLFVFATRRFR